MSLENNIYKLRYFLEAEERYMRRALELAALGRGSVSPNPMVGCIIVKADKIIGEGWHQRFGQPHAEVNAIQAVEDKSQLQGSALYVNLEPCSHYGKTPPCADLIVQYPFKKVVVCNIDTFSRVNGQGIRKLKDHGIEVISAVLEEKGRELNKRFFCFVEQKRPYVILKWAETNDGFIAREDYSSRWISGASARRLVHKWRSVEDGIMIGTKTAAVDDPSLDVRSWYGRNPVRIILDKDLKLPAALKIFDRNARTIIFNAKMSKKEEGIEYHQLDWNKEIPPQILTILYALEVQSVIVEGGTRLIQSFIDCHAWDEARIFRAKEKFKSGIISPRIKGITTLVEKVGQDSLTILTPNF